VTPPEPQQLPAPIEPSELWALLRELFAALGEPFDVPASVPSERTDLPPLVPGQRRWRTEWTWRDGGREAVLAQEDEWTGQGHAESGGTTVEARVEGLPGRVRLLFPSRPWRLSSYVVQGVPEAASAAEAALLRLTARRLLSLPVAPSPSTLPEWTRLTERASLAAPVVATCLGHACLTEVDGAGFGVLLEHDRRVPLGPVPRGGALRSAYFTGADGAIFPRPLSLLRIALGGEALPQPVHSLEGGIGERAARISWRCVTAGPWIARSSRRASSGGAGFDEHVVVQQEGGEPLAILARYRLDCSWVTLRDADGDACTLTLEVDTIGRPGEMALAHSRIATWLEKYRWTRRSG